MFSNFFYFIFCEDLYPEIAFEKDISPVSVYQAKNTSPNQEEATQDVIETETSTPKAKRFIETLMEAPFYDPETLNFTIRHPSFRLYFSIR